MQHKIGFAAYHPCRMFGWSYSKVVIPIADFHAQFLFLFFIVIFGEKKKVDKSRWTYRLCILVEPT